MFRVLVTSKTLSPERPLKTTFGQKVWGDPRSGVGMGIIRGQSLTT